MENPHPQASETNRITSSAVETIRDLALFASLPWPLKIVAGTAEFMKIAKNNPEQAKALLKSGGIGLGCAVAAGAGVLSELTGLVLRCAGVAANAFSSGSGETMLGLSNVCCLALILAPPVAAALAHPKTREIIVNGVVKTAGAVGGVFGGGIKKIEDIAKNRRGVP